MVIFCYRLGELDTQSASDCLISKMIKEVNAVNDEALRPMKEQPAVISTQESGWFNLLSSSDKFKWYIQICSITRIDKNFEIIA